MTTARYMLRGVVAWAPQVIALGVMFLCLARLELGTWLDFSRIPAVKEGQNPALALSYIFLACTILTIFLGAAFLLVTFMRDARHISVTNAVYCHRAAALLTLLSVALCMVWGLSLPVDGVRAVFPSQSQPYFHELFALIIFSVFVVIDALAALAATIELKHLPTPDDHAAKERKEALEEAHAISIDSIALVDGPVVVGLMLILLLQRLLLHDPYLSAGVAGAAGSHSLAEWFAEGVSLGAICMHLTLSQFVFGMLKMRQAFQRPLYPTQLRDVAPLLNQAPRSARIGTGLVMGAVVCSVFILFYQISYRSRRIVVLGEKSSNIEAMEHLEQECHFNEHVTVSFEARPYEEAEADAVEALKTGNSRFDVIMQYNFSLSEFVRNKYIVPLADIQHLAPARIRPPKEDDFFPGAWQELAWYYDEESGRGAKPIGYPFAENTMLLVYNKFLFEDAGHKARFEQRYGYPLAPPKTWEQFRQIAEYFTPEGGKTYGLAMQGKGEWLYYEWCNLAFTKGKGVMQKERGWESDETTVLLLSSPETVDASQLYVELTKFIPPDVEYGTIDADKQRALMWRGNVAMALMWSDYLYELVYSRELSHRQKAMFGFAPIPGESSMIAGGVFYINGKTNHREEAVEYLATLLQTDNQVRLAKRGLCSPIKAVYDDPGVQELPYIAALKQSLERGRYMLEAGPDAKIIQSAITSAITDARSGKVSVRDGLARAEQDIWNQRKIMQAKNE